MRKITVLFLIMLITGNCFSQQTHFQRTIGTTGNDQATSVQQTTDGGFIILSQTTGSVYGNGIYLIKTNAEGDTTWTKIINSGISSEYTQCIRQVADGGYVITGYTRNFNTGSVLAMFLMKTDAYGNFLWEKIYANKYQSLGINLRETTDGGFIIVGRANFDSLHFTSIIVKTDSFGDTLWTKKFGGTYFKIFYDVRQTTDGGYIVGGNSYAVSNGSSDIIFAKLDALGNLIWIKAYGGTSSDFCSSIQQTFDGGYIICGYTGSFGSIGTDIILIKTDEMGNVVFAKTFGYSTEDLAFSVTQTVESGYFICGYTSANSTTVNNPFAIKTDSLGNMIWSKTYGCNDMSKVLSGQQTTDGGFIMVGDTRCAGGGGSEVYIIKTNTDGISGCLEQSPTTITGSPSITTSTCPITIYSGATVYSVADSTIHTKSGGDETIVCYTADVSEINNESTITLSPNPATNQLTVSSEQLIIKEIKIINVLGESVLLPPPSLQGGGKGVVVDVSTLPNGIYFVQITSFDKLRMTTNVVNKKVVVQ